MSSVSYSLDTQLDTCIHHIKLHLLTDCTAVYIEPAVEINI